MKGTEIDYVVNHFMLSDLHLGEFFPNSFLCNIFLASKTLVKPHTKTKYLMI